MFQGGGRASAARLRRQDYSYVDRLYTVANIPPTANTDSEAARAEREGLAGRMTREQIAEARNLARE